MNTAKNSPIVKLSTEDRMRMIANIIIDRILEDRKNDKLPVKVDKSK